MFFLFLLSFLVVIATWAAVIVTFISLWKVHEKAGLPGWSGLVPYYNYFVRAEKLNMKDMFWNMIKLCAIALGVNIIGSIILLIMTLIATATSIGAALTSAELGIATAGGSALFLVGVASIVGIAVFVFLVMAMVQLFKLETKFAERFGKSQGFAIGMFLLPFVFYPILAWGSAKWETADYVVDPIVEPTAEPVVENQTV